MKLLWLPVLGLVLVPPSFGAADAGTSGTLLLESCKAAEATQDAIAKGGSAAPGTEYDIGYCVGLVQGVAYVSSSYCSPEEVTISQDVRIVVKYLEENPEKLHLHAARLAEDALTKAFPCKK